jgi:tRNA A-37 threonylcarbamoyl transferase component Bud32
MDVPPKYQHLNAYFDFIRPSTPENKPNGTLMSNDSIAIVDDIEPVNKNRAITGAKRALQINTDLFGILLDYTPPKHNDREDDNIFLQLNFPHLKRPLYSPTPSEDSSSPNSPVVSNKKLAPSPIFTRQRKPSPATVSQSPAASFLANFMSPVVVAPLQQSTDYDRTIGEYSLGDTIGFGGFSTVRKAHYKDQTVAIKIIDQHLMTNIDRLRLDRELSIWSSLDHPNIVHLQRLIKHHQQDALSPTFYLVSDYCSGGNLLAYLNLHKRINETEARRLFWQLCQGVRYLHVDRQVCHKDLKLENILLDEQGSVKICDFGLAIPQSRSDYLEEEMAGGSLAYAAPEQIRHVSPLTCPKTDIWSLGVILYALVVGSLPFNDAYELRLQHKILKGEFEMPVDVSQNLQQLISACLMYDPIKRWDIDAVLKSAWLSCF